jgi:hypothetical protein
VPVGVTGHRTQRPRGQVGPTQLLIGPRGRTAANIAASGPSDRAAGPQAGASRKPTAVSQGQLPAVLLW